MRKCYQQLYTHKLNNSDKTDQFLQRYKLPKHSQEETDKVNGSIIKETESIAKNFLTKKTPGPDGFTNKFNQASLGRNRTT